MPKLVSSFLVSLDGYVADEQGGFDWAVPDEEVLGFVTKRARLIGLCLCGRRLYQLMTGWEADPALVQRSAVAWDFAAWTPGRRRSGAAPWRSQAPAANAIAEPLARGLAGVMVA